MLRITESKRRAAFRIWTNAFNRYEIKLADAGGPFRKRWIESPSEFSDELTVAADILWGLSNSLTEKSVPVFADKVRALVRCQSENEYLMSLSELEVPALLAPRVSPIAFEPGVPLQANAAAKPSSSDHSVLLPSGEIFIEATTIDLRNLPTDTETVLKRIKRKLNDKRHQAIRDRVYLLAMKVLGPPQMFDLVRQLVSTRVWPNPQFRRYGGIIGFAETLGEPGIFQGMWLPNPISVAQPSTDVADLLCGRRCFHLQQVNNLECSTDEVSSLRRRAAAKWSIQEGVAVRVRLIDGPLNGIEILLKPTELDDVQITWVWDLKGTAKNKKIEMLMPPHGPVQITYRRREATLYEFSGFRLWIDEWRPSASDSEYLLRLSVSA